ncbi:polyprenyl synthetase [Halomicrobium urmianum]|uniref:polyprenyl synthetase n=1 Tax=Halomicrobium urmianum TaxID=1586233 RepID=UPI001CDA14A1|nr:polyprenyl synthetase [Halomicrobium urmianum]
MSVDSFRSAVDRRLEAAVESADRTGLSAARAVLTECDDRWYGRLLLRSYESVAGSASAGAVQSAAAAIELFRGYCRLRSELLDRAESGAARSPSRDPTRSLLAGDYLYSAAYSELNAVDHARSGACFETLSTASSRVVEAFASHYVEPASNSGRTLVDDTAGALGEGAAVVGATLAGVDGRWRDHFATLGHGLAVGRAVQRALEPGAEGFHLVSDPDERRLRQYADRRLAAADDALDELSAVDVARLRPLFEDVTGDAGPG